MNIRTWLLTLLFMTGQLVHAAVMDVNRIPFSTSRNHPGVHRTSGVRLDLYALQDGRSLTFFGIRDDERIVVTFIQNDSVVDEFELQGDETLYLSSSFPMGTYLLVVSYQGKKLYGTINI